MSCHITLAPVTPRRWPRHRRRLLSPVFGAATVATQRHLPLCRGHWNASALRSRTRPRLLRQPAYDHLNESQRTAVEVILVSRDQVMALEGAAGTGKTTALAAVRDAAEREGYQVEGFAPTSRAAHKLAESGIESNTLQHHLARGEEESPASDQKRLYVLDESSLASTKQMHTFLERLGPEDRVLLVGDVRQHEAVEAGRITNSRKRESVPPILTIS